MTLRVTEEDALVLVHARVREEQRRVVVGHDRRRGPVRVRVPLKIFDEGAADLGLGPALGRVGDALSQFHGLRLGLKLCRHCCYSCAAGAGCAAVVLMRRLGWRQAQQWAREPQSPASRNLAELAVCKDTRKRPPGAFLAARAV